MEKRKIIIGTYDTVADGLWTLTGLEFSATEMLTYFVEVPGRKAGPLDLSTVLTDGEPTYNNRTLTATFESSEGTYLEREERISTMVNELDGRRLEIVLPDDPGRYIVGRVNVAKEYNDQAHASVIVTAVCEPWRYSTIEQKYTLRATATKQLVGVVNSGRMTVVPLLTIANPDNSTTASFNLTHGSDSWALGPGSYTLPDLALKQGVTVIYYSGTGTATLTYREAVL